MLLPYTLNRDLQNSPWPCRHYLYQRVDLKLKLDEAVINSLRSLEQTLINLMSALHSTRHFSCSTRNVQGSSCVRVSFLMFTRPLPTWIPMRWKRRRRLDVSGEWLP